MSGYAGLTCHTLECFSQHPSHLERSNCYSNDELNEQIGHKYIETSLPTPTNKKDTDTPIPVPSKPQQELPPSLAWRRLVDMC